MLFTLLKANEDDTFSFYTATSGPLACFLIDRMQSVASNYDAMFRLENKPSFANDLTESERVFEMGGEVRYENDYRVFAAG